MNSIDDSFNRGAVRPVQCLSEGWELLKGDYWLFLGICLVGVLLAGIVPLAILQGPMMCGIFLCLLRRKEGQTVTFDMLFKGFDNFVQSLIATLIMIVPMLVIIVPAYVLFFFSLMLTARPTQAGPGKLSDPSPWAFLVPFALFMLFVMAVSIAVQVLFFFIYPLIVDRKKTGIEAVKLSARAGLGNFGGVLGLLVLNALLAIIGYCFCFVGVFFVIPVVMAAQAVAYRQVFPGEGVPTVFPGDSAIRE